LAGEELLLGQERGKKAKRLHTLAKEEDGCEMTLWAKTQHTRPISSNTSALEPKADLVLV
jgi:hypothetical protein